jgi:hypothetical protein
MTATVKTAREKLKAQSSKLKGSSEHHKLQESHSLSLD